jgi:hypothetical protein
LDGFSDAARNEHTCAVRDLLADKHTLAAHKHKDANSIIDRATATDSNIDTHLYQYIHTNSYLDTSLSAR